MFKWLKNLVRRKKSKWIWNGWAWESELSIKEAKHYIQEFQQDPATFCPECESLTKLRDSCDKCGWKKIEEPKRTKCEKCDWSHGQAVDDCPYGWRICMSNLNDVLLPFLTGDLDMTEELDPMIGQLATVSKRGDLRPASKKDVLDFYLGNTGIYEVESFACIQKKGNTVELYVTVKWRDLNIESKTEP